MRGEKPDLDGCRVGDEIEDARSTGWLVPVPMLALDRDRVAFVAVDQGKADHGHRVGLGHALQLRPHGLFVGDTGEDSEKDSRWFWV